MIDSENRLLTNENILQRLEKIDYIYTYLDKLKELKNGNNNNILIEALLLLRTMIDANTKRMINGEMKRIGIKAWESKK